MPVYALGSQEPEIHPDAYVHPDAVVIGSVVIGASSDESNNRYVDALAVSELLRLALLICPDLDEAEFIEARSGLRPVAQAGLPFFQEISANCVWTSGYYRHGVLMAPLAYRHVERRLA